MGWRADGGLWLVVRGGGLYVSKGTGVGISHTLGTRSKVALLKWNVMYVSAGVLKKLGVW